MGNGTPCVLKQDQPRKTSVLYVCHPEAKHEILSVAEVTTCEYEVVVLTPLLCAHPKYRSELLHFKIVHKAIHVHIRNMLELLKYSLEISYSYAPRFQLKSFSSRILLTFHWLPAGSNRPRSTPSSVRLWRALPCDLSDLPSWTRSKRNSLNHLSAAPLRPERWDIHRKMTRKWVLDVFFLISMFDFQQEEVSPVREEAFTSTHKPMTVGGQSQITVGTTHISRLTDDQLIKEFLSGSYCLHGVSKARA